jgi:peroxiredoxin
LDQIVDLEGDWDRFAAMDVKLVSIMVDPLPELKAEVQARGLKSLVATDEDLRVSNMYGALAASMHPGMKPGHTFVLIDKAGQMVWRWDWPGHGTPMYVDVAEVYKAVSARLKASS